MNMVVEVTREAKAQLIDKVVMRDGGKHPMKIVAVGNYCPAEDTIYLHLSSTTKVVCHGRNGKIPVQYCGWFYRPELIASIHHGVPLATRIV
jgi:hypothetical protein